MNLILTGGHSGIGLELTKILLKEGHHLGLILRNEGRKASALEAIGTEKQIDFFFADLGDQEAVIQVADDIKAKWDYIDGIFNNAGLLADKAYYSKQGNEMQFEINALSPYILTKRLKPLLDQASAPFVINTATGAMNKFKKLDLADLKRPEKFVKLMGSYMNSKFAMVQLMKDLAQEWPNIRIVTVNPGPNKTKMTAGTGMPSWLLPLRNLFFPKATKGAKKLYDAAFGSQFQSDSGTYITSDKAVPVNFTLSEPQMKQLKSNIEVTL